MRNEKLIFLFLNQNIFFWGAQRNRLIETFLSTSTHNILKLIGKKKYLHFYAQIFFI